MSGILELSHLVIILGTMGFTRGGLPFSIKTRFKGARGRAVGALILVGWGRFETEDDRPLEWPSPRALKDDESR